MASNYSSDPKNISPVSNSSTPQNGASNALPNSSPPPSASLTPSAYGRALRQLSPGTALSSARYKIENSIAEGGMGAVYRAIDTRFNRPCAVKEMLDEFRSEEARTQSLEWFSREATLLLDLNHPCIPRVRDF